MRLICIIAVFISFFCGCTKENESNEEGEIMIEGWIEDGEFPIVIVTRTIPVKTNTKFSLKQDSLVKYVSKTAKVTITSGDERVVLTSRTKDDYFPPFIYTTGRMRGKAGESYHLEVEWEGDVCEADCVIPSSPEITDIECIEETPRKFLLHTEIKDTVNSYFAAFVRVDSLDNTRHLSRQSLTQGATEMTIDRSFDGKYFEEGQIVRLSIVSMNMEMFKFWRDYDNLSTFSKNPLFPYSKNLGGNINGGLGYWAGYGVCRKAVFVKGRR